MKPIQIKNNIINLDLIRKISYHQDVPSTSAIDDRKLFNVELTYSNGDKENYAMTYEKFQQLIESCDDKLAFVVDDELNTVFAEDIK